MFVLWLQLETKRKLRKLLETSLKLTILEEKKMAISKEDILETVSKMSVMEVVELISAMEEKFGVSAAVAVAAAPVAAAAVAEEQTEFDVF